MPRSGGWKKKSRSPREKEEGTKEGRLKEVKKIDK
jgi:hypothetical protein